MSIATEITRIQQAKADIKTAIEAKGVVIPSGTTLDAYDDYIEQISGGGAKWIEPISLESFTSTTLNKIAGYIANVEIPSGVTSIDNSAFDTCSSLTSITIPNSVTSIGNSAFARCPSLSSITIPDSVTNIGYGAFQSCTSLTSCTIGSGVTSIGNSAFYNCSGLTSIVIPDSVTSISNGAFYNCSGLTSVTVNATTPPALSNANAFNNTNNCPIYVPSESVTTYQTTGNWASLSSRIQAIPNS